MMADFIEYLVVAMIGEAACQRFPEALFAEHHHALALLADREFELLGRIDPEGLWHAHHDRPGAAALAEAEAYIESLDRLAYGHDREWC